MRRGASHAAMRTAMRSEAPAFPTSAVRLQPSFLEHITIHWPTREPASSKSCGAPHPNPSATPATLPPLPPHVAAPLAVAPAAARPAADLLADRRPGRLAQGESGIKR